MLNHVLHECLDRLKRHDAIPVWLLYVVLQADALLRMLAVLSQDAPDFAPHGPFVYPVRDCVAIARATLAHFCLSSN